MQKWFPSMSGPPHCINGGRGNVDSEFGTICCDGDIMDTRFDMYDKGPRVDVDLADLVCCRNQGPQPQQQSLPHEEGNKTRCTAGTPVPLLSLAATNTQNAQSYFIGYNNITYGAEVWENFPETGTPYCLWFNSAKATSIINITVPAAQITTMSSTPPLPGLTIEGTPTTHTMVVTQSSTSSSQVPIPTKSIPAPTKSVAAIYGGTAVWRSICLLAFFYIGTSMMSHRAHLMSS